MAGRVDCVACGSQGNRAEENDKQSNRRPHPNSFVELDIHAFTTYDSRMRNPALEKAENDNDGKRASRMTKILVAIFDVGGFR